MTTKTRKRPAAKASKSTTKNRKPRPAKSDNRSTDRTQLFVAATLYTELNPDIAHKVWVTNISLGGLGFRTRRDFSPGATFHVRLEAGPIDMDSGIRIIWTRPAADGTFEVGCEFLPD